MKSAADATASSACSGLAANRTSLPTPLRNSFCNFCLSSEAALAGDLDAFQTAIPPKTRKARTVAMPTNSLRGRPLIKLIKLSFQTTGFADAKREHYKGHTSALHSDPECRLRVLFLKAWTVRFAPCKNQITDET